MLLAALAFLAEAAAPAAPPHIQTVRSAAPPPAFQPPSCNRGCLSAVEAVTYASYLGDKAGVAGTFEMPVVGVGQQNGLFYLNSERDYRDRNCLTIAMTPAAVLALVGTADPDQVRKRLRGHRILVRGVAQQVRINFMADGKPTEKYYYQVHVRVAEPGQIRVTS